MPDSLTSQPPGGLVRRVLRLPIWMYRLGLGGLLGGRFVLINHVGRRTGRVRQVVVEVVGRDPAQDVIHVASGWGPTAQWYQNLLAEPHVTIQIGRRTTAVMAVPVAADEGMRVLLRYRDAHPWATRQLGRVLGLPLDGAGPEELRRLAAGRLPVVALRPR